MLLFDARTTVANAATSSARRKNIMWATRLAPYDDAMTIGNERRTSKGRRAAVTVGPFNDRTNLPHVQCPSRTIPIPLGRFRQASICALLSSTYV